MSLTINDILLAQNIRRWTIVATKTDQSLAEHTFNVTMIARAICAEADINDNNVIKYALDHDLDEILTGDIPSPAKRRLGLTDAYQGKNGNISDVEYSIVKIADLIDATLFIKYNAYDRHGKVVANYTAKKLDQFISKVEMHYPDVANAAENVLAMIEHGKYETEVRDGS